MSKPQQSLDCCGRIPTDIFLCSNTHLTQILRLFAGFLTYAFPDYSAVQIPPSRKGAPNDRLSPRIYTYALTAAACFHLHMRSAEVLHVHESRNSVRDFHPISLLFQSIWKTGSLETSKSMNLRLKYHEKKQLVKKQNEKSRILLVYDLTCHCVSENLQWLQSQAHNLAEFYKFRRKGFCSRL